MSNENRLTRVHPGEYIQDALDSLSMTAREFSLRTGISERTLSEVLNGKGSITFDIANKLSSYFGNSINFWVNLQTGYNEFLDAKREQEAIKEDYDVVKTIKNYLVDFGITSESATKEVLVRETRKAIGVNRLTALCQADVFVNLKEQHGQHEASHFAQNFWISLALTEAREKNELPFDKNRLKESLPELRSLTKEDPSYFYPRMQEILKQCGVSFVLLPYLSKSNIYGATKWFSKENVMLALSNRQGRADIFWFTFFHELAHIFQEHRRELLIQVSGIEDDQADQEAKNMLIPQKSWDSFIRENHFSTDSIRGFAKTMGILPSIVLGRLQKEQKVPFGTLLDRQLHTSYQIVLKHYENQ